METIEDSKQPDAEHGVKDLSESHHEVAAREIAHDPEAKRIARRILNTGNLVFTALAVALFFPMLYAIGQGIYTKRAWDPHSGRPALSQEDHGGCIEEAQRLMLQAAKETALRPAWDDPQSEWNRRCKEQHADLYDMLNRTRTMLYQRGKGR
jgi:hypothetical protein